MKRKLIFAFLTFVFLGFMVLFVFNSITKKTADWQYIQQAGGIKTGTPLKTEDGLYLPIICNVSGTDSITTKPTMINSAFVCTKIKINTDGNKILIKVILGIATLNKGNCFCKAVNIGNLKPADYLVYYKDNSSSEHEIGQFTISDFP
jgi:hypothetical protein